MKVHAPPHGLGPIHFSRESWPDQEKSRPSQAQPSPCDLSRALSGLWLCAQSLKVSPHVCLKIGTFFQQNVVMLGHGCTDASPRPMPSAHALRSYFSPMHAFRSHRLRIVIILPTLIPSTSFHLLIPSLHRLKKIKRRL